MSFDPVALGFRPEDHISVVMPGKIGMHARPAARLMKALAGLNAVVMIVAEDGKNAHVKSIAAVLSMGIEGGAPLQLFAKGDQAKQALELAGAAFKEGLGELTPAAEGPKEAPQAGVSFSPKSFKAAHKGVSAVQGLAIGAAFRFSHEELHLEQKSTLKPEAELAKLKEAVAVAQKELAGLMHTSDNESPKYAIFEAHTMILQEERLMDLANEGINRGETGAYAWQQSYLTLAKELAANPNKLLAERAMDVKDVGLRVLHILLGVKASNSLSDIHTETILIAEDLTPSETSQLNARYIRGIALTAGGRTSHASIIARALGIPTIVSTDAAISKAKDGAVMVLDGFGGVVYEEVDAASLEAAKGLIAMLEERRMKDEASKSEPAILKSGEYIEVAANIGDPKEAVAAYDSGADAIGLTRSEFLFLNRTTLPTEEEQFEVYTSILKSMHQKPVIVRTLDIGSDKTVTYLPLPPEPNPALGLRGVRLSRHYLKELMIPQIRALIRSAGSGKLRIMFPMIALVDEIRETKRLIAEQCRELNIQTPIEIGIMIEVPSAVIMARDFAKEVDFFSIGTNDLTSYTLAMDRQSPTVAKNVSAFDPAVLRLIRMAVEAADERGIWVGVCGSLASEPFGALLLVGLGVKELSTDPVNVPSLKSSLRRYTLAELQAVAQKALACENLAGVEALSKSFV